MRGSAEPAVDEWIDTDLEDRLSGSLHGDPEEAERTTDPDDDDDWFDAQEQAFIDQRLSEAEFEGERW